MEITKEMLSTDGLFITCINNPSDEECMIAIRNNPSIIHCIEQTPERCKLAVFVHGSSLMYIKEQTPDICEIAVKNCWSMIKHVNHQTDDLCLLAIRQSVDALLYIRDQSPFICEKALKKDLRAIAYIHEAEKTVLYPSFGESHYELVFYRYRGHEVIYYDDTFYDLKSFEQKALLDFEAGKIRQCTRNELNCLLMYLI